MVIPGTVEQAHDFAAPGSVLEIRDETWLVLRTETERVSDGWFVEVQGLRKLVRGTQATFSTALDRITLLGPATTRARDKLVVLWEGEASEFLAPTATAAER